MCSSHPLVCMVWSTETGLQAAVLDLCLHATITAMNVWVRCTTRVQAYLYMYMVKQSWLPACSICDGTLVHCTHWGVAHTATGCVCCSVGLPVGGWIIYNCPKPHSGHIPSLMLMPGTVCTNLYFPTTGAMSLRAAQHQGCLDAFATCAQGARVL
jgi:hypothetical protein